MVRYQNPILPGFHPDPSICRVGRDYYLVTSSFEYFPGVPIFHSRDLTHWRQIGYCLERDSQLPLAGLKSSDGIYAPTLRYHDGTFYMVTTNVRGTGNFYVTARDAAGPWSEPVSLSSVPGIDPSLLFDDDGRVYLTRQGGGERGGIYQQELDVRRGVVIGDPQMIWSGTGGTWPEGPHLYKIAGRYYLMIAEGGTGYEHMVTIARSSSPWGPFESCPRNPILSHRDRKGHPIQATGHADLLEAEDGTWWLVFLGIRPPDGKHHHLGRETFLSPVTWDGAGWPVINGDGSVELELDGESLPPQQPSPTPPVRDDFIGPALGMNWNFVRNPDPASWSLSARPGWLRLLGSQASLDDLAQPAFVGRRQEHLSCRASTLLEFEPRDESELAGLVVRASEGNHYDLLLLGAGSSRRVELRTCVRGQSEVVTSVSVPAGPVTLSIDASEGHYEFYCAGSDRALYSLGTRATAPLSSEQASGFTGVYFGLHACSGKPGVRAAAADFDWFDYQPNRT
jgi:alpha-N-arabinofuranosidase